MLAALQHSRAVVGGLLFAAVVTLLRGAADVGWTSIRALLTPLNIMFFTTVGLSADARALARGGKVLVLFFVVIVGGILMQNVVGIAMALLFDLHPVNGLITGSIALSGGAGTDAAWAGKFVEERNLQGAIELGIAAATYGLVVGGVHRRAVWPWLMRRYGVRGSEQKAGTRPRDDDAAACTGRFRCARWSRRCS